MRSVCRFLILLSLATLVGCGLLPKKGAETTPPSGFSGDRLPAAGAAQGNNTQGNTTSRNALLAGQVIDAFSQRKGGVSLTLQPVDGGDAVQAITNDQGYFTVNGLQAGKRYKITAKAQNGAVVSTGFTEATAPNVVVLVKLNDSRTDTDGKSAAMSGTIGGRHPSMAGPDENPPTWSRGNPASTGKGDRLGAAPDVTQPPGNNGTQAVPTSAPGVNPRLGRPVTAEPPPPSSSNVPERPEYIAISEPRTKPPTLDIRGPNSAVPGEQARPSNAGNSYLDLPLLDLDGRTTSLASYRGRLTLVDLWNTDCIPCVQAMTELMKVQRTYNSQGLVVVGIAVNERGKTQDNADKIRWRTGQKGVDYPLLMEQPSHPAATAFKVEQVPTLVLLDEAGREVWRGVGFNPDTKKALEQELQRRLR
ncbi:MAG TPA: redoxin family protein [Gemmatales bacterium]|nr:redoxin family protein [Gemmatales bacterium]